MHSAREQIERVMPKTDAVVEILDARVPLASQNPILDDLRRGTPRLVLLNKEDLADPRATKRWLARFAGDPTSASQGIMATDQRQVARAIQKARAMSRRAPGPGRPVRILVVGIPNVGKSTLLNSLVRRRIARVGDEPAVTKGQQIIDVEPGLRVIDTPGLLWPKFDDEARAFRLAASGAIRDVAVDEAEVAWFLLDFLLVRYKKELVARFKLKDAPKDGRAALDAIGRKRGCLVAGGEVDPVKAGQIVLTELRSGRIGRISLEHPE